MTPIDVARAIAAKRHASPGVVEIDPCCEVVVIPGGIWVAAWLFVSTADINKEAAREMPEGIEPCTI